MRFLVTSLFLSVLLLTGCSKYAYVTPLSIEQNGFGMGFFYRSVIKSEGTIETTMDGLGVRIAQDRLAIGHFDEAYLKLDPSVKPRGRFADDSMEVYWGEDALLATNLITEGYTDLGTAN